MGNLVLKTIKTTRAQKGNTGYITYGEYSGDTDTYNPSAGYISLKPFNISFPIGVKTNINDNLSRNQPRISVGSRMNIPITFQLSMSEHVSADLVESINYLAKTAFSDYISLLYFMPNSDDDIITNQDTMYWSSLIRILVNNIWDGAKITKTNAEYIGSVNYEPYCIPIKIVSIDPLAQQANKKSYNITVNAEVLGMEED